MVKGIRLQVLICTYGQDGIERVAHGRYPPAEGVEYLVSWQASDSIGIPKELDRDDFKIFRTDSKGLSKNRNHALSKSSADFLLISDDDADYFEHGLTAIIDSFEKNSDADLITFKYDTSSGCKIYPETMVSLNHPPKGYYVSSLEIALRRSSIVGKVWFNENFGIGAHFPSGEEDIFIRDCLDAGLTGKFIPITIAIHDGPTTSEKNLMLASRPQTKGAVFNRLHPFNWPLRMVAHALREIPLWRKGIVPSPVSFCLNWIKGSCKASKMKVFPTPDYSNIYLTTQKSKKADN